MLRSKNGLKGAGDISQITAAHPAAELAGHARRRRPPASFSCVQYKKPCGIGFYELNDLQ
jgi:hypothetical protein